MHQSVIEELKFIHRLYLENQEAIADTYSPASSKEDFVFLSKTVPLPSFLEAYGKELVELLSLTDRWPIHFYGRRMKSALSIGDHSSADDKFFLKYAVEEALTREEFPNSEGLLWRHQASELLLLDDSSAYERERLIILKGGESGWLSVDGFFRRGNLISVIRQAALDTLP